ncbi:MAG: hypothetical protein ABI772_07790 [Bacteroidota bacterium]
MRKLTEIQAIGSIAVKKLRESKLEKGLPFMINTRSLPSNQAYLEYPNGSISIVQIFKSAYDFTLVKQLDTNEIQAVRSRYHLYK